METVITRDSDIIREYLAALDNRERGVSLFARLVAVTKLARLRRELERAHIESTDEDLVELRREINDRINRTAGRRLLAKPLVARLFAFGVLIVGQLLLLGVLWLTTRLFIRFAPVPRRWNPVLPHEQPGFLYILVFLTFFLTPILALLLLFGGRYFRAWRQTAPATVLLFAASVALTAFIVIPREKTNPVRHSTSLEQLAKDREVTVGGYRDWTGNVWLMRDPEFQRDYESYLREGPGRWITSRFEAEDDLAWRSRNDDSDSLKLMSDYLDNGQDPNAFREWLKYYLDRHRIYSEDRIDQEVSAITGSANQRYLGLWQMEPYLKERDQRLYRAYLSSIDSATKRWALGWLGVLALVFLGFYFVPAVTTTWTRLAGSARRNGGSGTSIGASAASQPSSQRYAFPERTEITTPPFFDTPFRLLGGVHRSFMRFAIGTSVIVFLFWVIVYALDLSSEHPNPPTQQALLRSAVLLESHGGWPAHPIPPRRPTATSVSYITVGRLLPADPPYGPVKQAAAADRVAALERQLDESDYQSSKRFKQQYEEIAAQKSELNGLKTTTAQLQQQTTSIPEQISDIGSRANAAEARAGQVGSEATAAKQAADQLSSKIKDVESRATRAADQVGRVETQVSALATRTEALDRELEQRARQIEARTEELGERTAGLKDLSERTQRIAFNAILSELTSSIDELDRRVSNSFYRFVNKADSHRDADTLSKRIESLTTELRELNTEAATQWIAQLDELAKRLQEIAARIK